MVNPLGTRGDRRDLPTEENKDRDRKEGVEKRREEVEKKKERKVEVEVELVEKHEKKKRCDKERLGGTVLYTESTV